MSRNGRAAAIVGAGVIGCLAAIGLARRGYAVTVYEAGGEAADDGHATSGFSATCTRAAGGMLSPVCELGEGEPAVHALGKNAVDEWQGILQNSGGSDLLHRGACGIAAYPGERGLLDRVRSRIAKQEPMAELERLGAEAIQELAPGLNSRIRELWRVADDGFLDAQKTLAHMRAWLEANAALFYESPVTSLGPGSLEVGGETSGFDLVVDTRGMGMASDIADLRGVRGEGVFVQAPEVELRHNLRILHPRTPIYIVPRGQGVYFVGATSIESEDTGPVRVRSLLELLGGLYTVHSGFKEAQILGMIAGLRSAIPSNLPFYEIAPGFLRLGGFYRHGFLLGPNVVESVLRLYHDEPCGELIRSLEYKRA